MYKLYSTCTGRTGKHARYLILEVETADTAHVAHITSLISTLLPQFRFPIPCPMHFPHLFPNPFPLSPNPFPPFLFISRFLSPLVSLFHSRSTWLSHSFPFLFRLLSLKNFPPLHSSLFQNSLIFFHRFFNIPFPFLLLVPPLPFSSFIFFHSLIHLYFRCFRFLRSPPPPLCSPSCPLYIRIPPPFIPTLIR